jgi:hypothetical protein
MDKIIIEGNGKRIVCEVIESFEIPDGPTWLSEPRAEIIIDREAAERRLVD